MSEYISNYTGEEIDENSGLAQTSIQGISKNGIPILPDNTNKVNINVPTKTSDLVNDSGFLTSHQSLAEYRTSAQQDIIDASKANDDEVVKITGNQNVGGIKTFTDSVQLNSFLDASIINVNSFNNIINNNNDKLQDIIDLKINKTDASAGNIGKFDASGNIIDSGIIASDVVTSTGHYPNIIAGKADGLITRGTTDEMFSYRVSAGVSNIEDGEAHISKIKGNTIVWNQLIGNFSNSLYGIDFSIDSSGIATLNGTAEDDVHFYGIVSEQECGGRYNHKILIRTNYISGTTTTTSLNIDMTYAEPYDVSIGITDILSGGKDVQCTLNYKDPCNEYMLNIDNIKEGDVFTDFRFYIGVYDLTQMFGKDNENTSFNQLFSSYYTEYNIGQLINFNGTSIKTNGFNQWDEEWELGSFNDSTGEKTSGNKIISKNAIRIIPNEKYCFYMGNMSTSENIYIKVYQYDTQEKYLGYYRFNNMPGSKQYMDFSYDRVGPGDSGKIFKNTSLIKFQVSSYYGSSYSNNICINISHTGYKDGIYEKYWSNIHNLPNYTLKSVGNVFDEITDDNKLINRVNSISNLGNIIWGQNGSPTSGGGYFYAKLWGESGQLSDIPLPAMTQQHYGTLYCTNIISDTIYTPNRGAYGGGNSSDNYITFVRESSSTGYTISLFICSDKFENVNELKAYLSGKTLYYEMETPIKSSISFYDGYSYKIADFGTELVLPNNFKNTPITSPFKASMKYALNAVDTLRNLDSNYVAVNKTQNFTSVQKDQARNNIGAAGASDIIIKKSNEGGAHMPSSSATGYLSFSCSYQGDSSGAFSFAEGNECESIGDYSHAAGCNTKSIGEYSHTEGYYTIANNEYEFAVGINNKSNTSDVSTLFSIGCGESDGKNAFEVDKNGYIYVLGVGGYDGTNPDPCTNSLQKILSSLTQ